MKVCACVLLFTVFANFVRNAASSHSSQDEKSVHLTLETVLEFNNKDKESDIKFLDKVQNFVNKVRTVIDKTANYRRDFKNGEVESLTDFIQETVKVLNSYDDTAFNDFFSILDDEIRKYHYRGCKFYELTENFEIRSLFGSALDQIKGKPILVIKAYINVLADVLKEENYDKNVKEIIDYINSLYRKDSKAKLNKVIQEIENYGKAKSRRNRNTLVKILREGIRSIIFDHYTELIPNARRALKSKIEMFLKKSKETSVLPYTVTVRNIGKVEKPPKKSLTHGVYKKGAVKTEHKFDRIDIRNTDFKKNHLEKDDGYKKKDARHVRKEKNKQSKFSEIPLKTENEKKELRARSEEESTESSSSEDESITTETMEQNSIAMSQEKHREYNHMRYMTLYPEGFTSSESAVSPKIMHRAVKVTIPAQQRVLTMWVEETTGGIPEYILNKYTSTKKPKKTKHKKTHKKKDKKKHKKSKHNKHDKYKTTEGTQKKHGHKAKQRETTRHTKRYVAKHATTYKPKQQHYTSKYKKKQKYSNDERIHKWNEKNETGSAKKLLNMFGPVRLDVNHNLLLKNITVRQTKSTPPSLVLRQKDDIEQLKKSLKPGASTAKSKIGLLLPASLAAISKRYKMLSGPRSWDLRKNAELQTDEGISIEKDDKDIAKAKRRQASSSVENPFVIKRMKELENELKEVKNKINTVMKKKGAKQSKKLRVGHDKSNKEGKNDIKDRGDKVKEKYSANEDKESENNIKESESYENASEDVSNDNPREKTKEIITTVTEKQKVTTVKKPEYQLEYKIVKEKGSDFKEIIPDRGTEETKPVAVDEEKNADTDSESTSGKTPLEYNAKRHSNDKIHKNLHNKTNLIDSSTKMSATEYTTTKIVTTTEKILKDVTSTKKHQAKTTTVASTTSVAIENMEKATNSDAKQHKSTDAPNKSKEKSDKNVVENSLANDL